MYTHLLGGIRFGLGRELDLAGGSLGEEEQSAFRASGDRTVQLSQIRTSDVDVVFLFREL